MKKRFDLSKKADLARDQEIRDYGRKFAAETHFTQPECEAILKLHANMTADTPLDRMQFRSVLFSALEISNTFILDRIFRVCDRDDDGLINGEEFLRCLSTMMRGKLEELTAFCYDVYDVNGDRSLAREELFMCLEGSVRPGRGIVDDDEVEDSVKDIVEIAMKKLDVNWDGQITYDDFQAAVQADPLLLQVCGMCLPPTSYSRGIQYLFTMDYKKLTPVYKENWAALELRDHRKGKNENKDSHVPWVTFSKASTGVIVSRSSSRQKIQNEKALSTLMGLPLEDVKDVKGIRSSCTVKKLGV